MSSKAVVQWIAVLVLVAGGSGPAIGADIWVSGTGHDGTGDGSSGNPFRTITVGMQTASANDVIKVRAGTYGVGDGESFPIEIKSGVDIRGQETLLANFPRIGGDVVNSLVNGLFEVNATTDDLGWIELYRLYFVGEDSNNKDAPSVLHIEVAGGHSTDVVMEACFVERSEMNDSGNADRACVSATVGSGECSLIVDGSVLYATERGGIEMLTGTDTTDTLTSTQVLDVQRCQILVTGTDTADFGIRWLASGEEWLEGGDYPDVNISSNLIDSSGASSSSYGILTGLEVAMEPAGDGVMTLQHPNFVVAANVIKACRGDGIWLRNNPDSIDAYGNMSIFNLKRNKVMACGGAGLRIQRSDDEEFAGYLNVQSISNWYVKNGDGVVIEGDEIGSPAGSHFVNDTIAYNSAAGYGFVIADSLSNAPTQITNCIVYGNHNGGVQYDGGGTGWDPVEDTATTYCDWQGLSGGDFNIDADPDFVNVSTGDFHLLDDESPCVDAGDNNPDGAGPGEFDIDADRRVVDGDGDTTPTVDIGADEFEP